MPEFLVFTKAPNSAVAINHINAADIATAQTVVTGAIDQFSTASAATNPGSVLVGIVALGAAFTVTAT